MRISLEARGMVKARVKGTRWPSGRPVPVSCLLMCRSVLPLRGCPGDQSNGSRDHAPGPPQPAFLPWSPALLPSVACLEPSCVLSAPLLSAVLLDYFRGWLDFPFFFFFPFIPHWVTCSFNFCLKLCVSLFLSPAWSLSVHACVLTLSALPIPCCP